MRKTINTYIGYSSDTTIRHKASSGGIGSALVKYILDNRIADYALSFSYDKENVCYKPVLVSSFEDYLICGSIYQEMNLIMSLKSLLNSIETSDKSKFGKKYLTERSRIVLFALPCQTRALRSICKKAGYESIIIGLTCSSQQSHEATSYLLKSIGIDEKSVNHIQYRGNGWPSGIQIKTKDNKDYFVQNNNSIWMDIFHSRLFIQPRCFFCNNTLNDYADMVLADPWLKEYVKTETEGQTLFASYTEVGEDLINKALDSCYIEARKVDSGLLFQSQKSTIDRKESYRSHPIIRNWMRKIFLSAVYKRFFKYGYLFRIHCKLKRIIESRIAVKA